MYFRQKSTYLRSEDFCAVRGAMRTEKDPAMSPHRNINRRTTYPPTVARVRLGGMWDRPRSYNRMITPALTKSKVRSGGCAAGACGGGPFFRGGRRLTMHLSGIGKGTLPILVWTKKKPRGERGALWSSVESALSFSAEPCKRRTLVLCGLGGPGGTSATRLFFEYLFWDDFRPPPLDCSSFADCDASVIVTSGNERSRGLESSVALRYGKRHTSLDGEWYLLPNNKLEIRLPRRVGSNQQRR